MGGEGDMLCASRDGAEGRLGMMRLPGGRRAQLEYAACFPELRRVQLESAACFPELRRAQLESAALLLAVGLSPHKNAKKRPSP